MCLASVFTEMTEITGSGAALSPLAVTALPNRVFRKDW